LFAREEGTPFYVISQTQKIFPWVKIEEEKREDEVWKKREGIKIKNIYFDVTPLPLVTAIITNEGLLKYDDIKKRCEHMKTSPLLKNIQKST